MIPCQKVTVGIRLCSLRLAGQLRCCVRHGSKMKCWLALALLVGFAGFLCGQTSAPSGSCGKNVSFAVAEGGQPVPAIPKFAAKWLDGKGHREHYPSLCFSQIPSSTLANFIVVFSTTENSFEGLKPSAQTYTSAGQSKDTPGGVSSYGGTWSYAYSGVAAPATTDTLDLKRDDKPKSVDIRAFDQTGRVISRRSLASFSSRDKLLEQVLTDIVNDSAPVARGKPFAAPLSVYYVNCNVPDQPPEPMTTASSTPPSAPTPTATPNKPPPPPDPELEVWSSPAGADIFVDGAFVGKTPYTLVVPPGEHTINLRKRDFAIWQRKITVVPGKRKVGANLEQKVLTLD